jgi:hypothetical protein
LSTAIVSNERPPPALFKSTTGKFSGTFARSAPRFPSGESTIRPSTRPRIARTIASASLRSPWEPE